MDEETTQALANYLSHINNYLLHRIRYDLGVDAVKIRTSVFVGLSMTESETKIDNPEVFEEAHKELSKRWILEQAQQYADEGSE